jgi:hypothetical protein
MTCICSRPYAYLDQRCRTSTTILYFSSFKLLCLLFRLCYFLCLILCFSFCLSLFWYEFFSFNCWNLEGWEYSQTGKKIVTVDKIFEILKSVHEGARAHTGYHKLYNDIEQTYYGIPMEGCVQCCGKKPQRNVAPLKPITSKYFLHRGQLDLDDKCADPDGDYCWIGHYIDHYTKFNFFWSKYAYGPARTRPYKYSYGHHRMSTHTVTVGPYAYGQTIRVWSDCMRRTVQIRVWSGTYLYIYNSDNCRLNYEWPTFL